MNRDRPAARYSESVVAGKMSIADASTSDNCLSCHGLNPPTAIRGPEFKIEEGNSCESCHSFGSRTTERKIDLLKRPGPDVLTGYVAAMWNHAPDMHRRAGSNFPIFGPGDMSNLVAYLFAQRYFDEEARIFADVIDEGQKAKRFQKGDPLDLAETLMTATNSLLPYSLSAFELGDRSVIEDRALKTAKMLIRGLVSDQKL